MRFLSALIICLLLSSGMASARMLPAAPQISVPKKMSCHGEHHAPAKTEKPKCCASDCCLVKALGIPGLAHPLRTLSYAQYETVIVPAPFAAAVPPHGPPRFLA